MSFFDRFRKGKENRPPQLVCTYPAEQLRWKRPAMLVWVPEGTGVLTERFGAYQTDTKPNAFLLLDDIPLVKWHFEECPTCDQLLAAGYGIDRVAPSIVAAIEECSNQLELTEGSLEKLSPLLNLLEPGLYLLSMVPHIPTDGEGNFFWEFPLEVKSYDAFYGMEGQASQLFMVPTQPKRKYDQTRVDTYRQQFRETGNLGGIAYHLDGAFSALLDGHHRATAAALEGVTLNLLTIMPATLGYQGREANIIKYVYACGENLEASAVLSSMHKSLNTRTWPDRQLSDEQTQTYQRIIAEEPQENPFPQELQTTVKRYLTFKQLNAIAETGIEQGELTDERIEQVFCGGWYEHGDERELEEILLALFAVHDPRAVPLAKRILKDDRWISLWLDAVKFVSATRTSEVEEFFIDWLIEDNKRYPGVTKVIVDYFQES